MKKQSLVFALLVLFLSPFFTSCKKINEATELGGELIPDNVNTFDTTLDVETFNGLFTDQEDSTSSNILQFLGNINNDPLFGKTEASMFFELKPVNIKSPFVFVRDSLVGLDSVILVLGYNSVHGDSTMPMQVAVREIPVMDSFNRKTNYLIRKNYFPNAGLSLGPVKTFIPQSLNDSIDVRGGRVANQLRIPLNNSFGMRLLNYDTTNAYKSDAEFKKFFAGFAVLPQNNASSNALLAFDLSESALLFYVRYKNAGKIDTTATSFSLSPESDLANYIRRDRAGSQLEVAVQSAAPDNLVYIQNAPGSFARIKIPGLRTLSNRVIHRAELIAEQVYDPLAPLLTPPPFLYLDIIDTVRSSYRTIPFDITLNQVDSNGYELANLTQFAVRRNTADGGGNPITRWNFNLSRYIQHVVNKTEPVQDLRLYSPFYAVKNIVGTSAQPQNVFTFSPYAIGRVRLGGGNHSTQKMKLRIVYSKL